MMDVVCEMVKSIRFDGTNGWNKELLVTFFSFEIMLPALAKVHKVKDITLKLIWKSLFSHKSRD